MLLYYDDITGWRIILGCKMQNTKQTEGALSKSIRGTSILTVCSGGWMGGWSMGVGVKGGVHVFLVTLVLLI